MACPTKPKEEIKITKQKWQIKEQKEEDEWQVVKKSKDKSMPTLEGKNIDEGTRDDEAEPSDKKRYMPKASSNPFDIKSPPLPKVKSKVTPQASTNIFDVLQSYHDNEIPKEEEENNPKSEEGNQQELEGNGKPSKHEPKQKTTTPSPLQAQHKKQLLDRIQKFNLTKEQALASLSAIKDSSSKSTKVKKK